MTAYTDDTFLGAKVTIRQPANGFRSGLDAVMLAASVPAKADDELLELGAGSGVASLCVAERVRDCRILGVEIDEELVRLANENARANHSEKRVSFATADVFSPPREIQREFDHVFSNPPFHGSEGGELPSSNARTRALHDRGQFTAWLETGVKRTISNGTFTCIIRADRLSEALSVLPEQGLTIFPLWPRANAPAKRLILQLRKNARAPLMMLPGLVLHTEDGCYTDEADAILRGGASLALASPRL